MSLGQLYYFEKEVSSLSKPITPDSIIGLSLPGNIMTHQIQESQNKYEAVIHIKDEFISVYKQYLSDNNYKNELCVWNYATSASTNPFQSNAHISSYAQEIIRCVDEGFDYISWNNLLKQGSLLTDSGDFSLYYGLHVLYALYQASHNIERRETLSDYPSSYPEALENSTSNSALVVCQNRFKPLFASVGCIVYDQELSETNLIKNVIDCIESNGSIQIILIQNTSLFHLVKKHTSIYKIPVVPIHLDQNNQDGFFDLIVKQTLGVKL